MKRNGSRKQDILVMIALRRLHHGWTREQVAEERRRIGRWHTVTLEGYWRTLSRAFPLRKEVADG